MEHYQALFTRLDLGRNLLNSAIVALTVTALSLLINSLAGYALAKLRFRFRERLFRTLSAGLLLPVQISMLPLFLLFKGLGLVNSYWGVIIPSLASIFGIFQRRLRIGYGRAARVIDQLHYAGILGPPDGSKPRDVLIGFDQLDEYCG